MSFGSIGAHGALIEKELNRKRTSREVRIRIEVSKSVWGMPRLSKAKKDVISCEKLRGLANTN